jgi:hypothetical protein
VLPGGRDLRFDTLRGLFLVIMTINHLPTEIRFFTDQSVGIFSAAEGFVFLSGLIAGWVYTRKYKELGPAGLLSASNERAKSIYRWHIGSFLASFVCVRAAEVYLGYCSPAVPKLFFANPLEAIGLGATLLYQPGLLDLLPMYCVFVLLLPVVVRALESGHRWLVLGASASVWLAVQWAPPVDGAPLYPINTGSFNLFAWQFLFVAGMAIGQARLSGLEQVARPRPWLLACCAAVVVYAFGIHHYQWPVVWPARTFGILLNKPALGLLRLADFGAFAYLVAAFGARFPRALTSRPLELLGRHSLAVVAAQSVAIMALLPFAAPFGTELARTLTAVGVVAFLFAVAWAHEGLAARSRASAGAIGTRQPPGPRLVRPDDARAA